MAEPTVRKIFTLPWALAEALEEAGRGGKQNAIAVEAISLHPAIKRILSEGLK